MKIKEIEKNAQDEISELLTHFQLTLSWKWVNKIMSGYSYFLISTVFGYAILIYLTFFPTGKVLPLKDFPSVNMFFLGGILTEILVIRWIKKAPSIFQQLWDERYLVESRKNTNLKDEYIRYLQNYRKALQSRIRPILLSIFLISTAHVFVFEVAKLPQYLSDNFNLVSRLLIFITYFIVFFWVFMGGFASWAILVTSHYIRKLTNLFTIRIQPSHSDRCGGLKPLGDYCLKLATPMIVAGFVLPIVSLMPWDKNPYMARIATLGLFLWGVFVAITVFFPVWDIHIYMVQQKRAYENTFANQAIKLEQAILTHTLEKGDLKKAEIANAKLKILQTVHPDKIPYPVWPLRFANAVLVVFSPQILQSIISFVIFIYTSFFKISP